MAGGRGSLNLRPPLSRRMRYHAALHSARAAEALFRPQRRKRMFGQHGRVGVLGKPITAIAWRRRAFKPAPCLESRAYATYARAPEISKSRSGESCGSSVVEHSLGKGEAESSILSRSTSFPLKILRGKIAPRPHALTIRGCAAYLDAATAPCRIAATPSHIGGPSIHGDFP